VNVVSIIVTTYNDHQYLIKALTSCLHQDIEKEVIVVDDHSSIKMSRDLLLFIRDNNIRLIGKDKNEGLSAARNTGISEAKYDLIIPLDADDFFMPNSIKHLLEQVDDCHHVFYGNVFDSASNQWEIPPSMYIVKQDFLRGNPLFCSSLFKKEIWRANGGYTVREHAHYEDYNFWAKAFKLGFKFKYCPINVYQHTFRIDGMLQTLHKSTNELKVMAIDEIFINEGKKDSWWNVNINTGIEDFKLWTGNENVESKVYLRAHIMNKLYKSCLDCGAALCLDFYSFKNQNYDIEYQAVDTCNFFIQEGLSKNIDIALNSIEKIDKKDKHVDVAYCRHVFEHIVGYKKALDEMIRVAKKEVLIIFFIKPSEKEKISYAFYENSFLYHNTYDKEKFRAYIEGNPRFDRLEITDINDKECCYHIYLK
jgi:glycosyltransferase involved in cell wall biosynthesis